MMLKFANHFFLRDDCLVATHVTDVPVAHSKCEAFLQYLVIPVELSDINITDVADPYCTIVPTGHPQRRVLIDFMCLVNIYT
jgi:hypothetical protein